MTQLEFNFFDEGGEESNKRKQDSILQKAERETGDILNIAKLSEDEITKKVELAKKIDIKETILAEDKIWANVYQIRCKRGMKSLESMLAALPDDIPNNIKEWIKKEKESDNKDWINDDQRISLGYPGGY